MEEMNTDDQLVTIHFDNDADVEMEKSYLIEHSAYFQAMFSGYFVESQAGHRIHIRVYIDVFIIKTSFFLFTYYLVLMN